MKKFILASVLLATATLTAASFAANLDSKTSNSNGSPVGQSSSSFTGNGAVIGGNGTGGGGLNETNAPGSRVNGAVYGVHSINNPPGQGGTAPGQVGK